MRSRNVRDHRVARRVAMASMSVLAASGIGLVAAPMAFGQIVIPIGGPLLGSSQSAGVSNSGSASANTGGNTAVGNASNNTASATAPAAGAVNVPVSLGAPSNTSTGTAQVTTGAANAVGNSSDATVGQSNASGNQVSSFLGGQNQSAGVGNTGAASANSGGNNAVGNGSRNNATVTQDTGGGLIGVGVTLGGPTNNSTGNATVTSGAANAVGNSAGSQVGQSLQGGGGGGGFIASGPGGGPGGPGGGPGGAVLATRPGPGGGGGGGAAPCGSSRFASFQDANVVNRGQAQANTGNNTAIGNNSTNNASTNVPGQTVSGALVGVGLTIGGPVNNSSGTATINTGPATAVGNDSSTTISQVQGCPQVVTIASRPGQPTVVVPGRLQTVQTATLARTGLDTGDLGMIAGGLLAAGMLLIASQRRRFAARHAAVPMAGLGFGLGADEWDGVIR
jgi:hypothetical protein